jgi:cytochrome c oxidase subunit 2
LNPQSEEARQIDGLWILVLVAMTIILVLVMAALVVSLIRFRDRGDEDEQEPKQVHGNTKLEIVWTIIPAVVLAVIAVPTVRTLFELNEEPVDALQVTVIGHQWWWEFRYPDIVGPDGRELVTANELHLPAGQTAYLTMTSADVIHSFWVPPLQGKRDVVPGRLTNLSMTPDAEIAGTEIPGQCAEFCWLAHADMRITVFVDSPDDFAAWAAAQLEPAEVPTDEIGAAAYDTFTQICTACHTANVNDPEAGAGEIGRALAPDLTHFGSRDTLGAGIADNDAAHLAKWLDNPESLKPMAPDLNEALTEPDPRILGMPDYGLNAEQIAGLTALLEGWK